jgi:hypothetical protein
LLPDVSAGRISGELWWKNQEFFSVGIIPPWFTMLRYHLGINNQPPVGGGSSEMWSHPIDIG